VRAEILPNPPTFYRNSLTLEHACSAMDPHSSAPHYLTSSYSPLAEYSIRGEHGLRSSRHTLSPPTTSATKTIRCTHALWEIFFTPLDCRFRHISFISLAIIPRVSFAISTTSSISTIPINSQPRPQNGSACTVLICSSDVRRAMYSRALCSLRVFVTYETSHFDCLYRVGSYSSLSTMSVSISQLHRGHQMANRMFRDLWRLLRRNMT
jgi:hypothetical protein